MSKNLYYKLTHYCEHFFTYNPESLDSHHLCQRFFLDRLVGISPLLMPNLNAKIVEICEMPERWVPFSACFSIFN